MTDHLGTGWAFPVGPDARGRIGLVSGVKTVEQAILMILMTPRGQRVMRPEYGCQIHDLIFAPNDASTLGLASYYVHEALTLWEPRIELQDVDADIDPDHSERIVIRVRYRLRSDSYTAAFYLARFPAGEKRLDFALYGRPEDVIRPSTGVISTSHAGRWITAFYLSMATLQPADIGGVLAPFPRELLETSSTVAAPFLLAQVDAYRAVYLQTDDAPEKMAAFLGATSFDNIEATDREYVLDISKNESIMLARLMMRDEEQFNAELELALEAHKHYHNRNATAYDPDGNVRNDPQHWIYLAGMGMAAWARMLGMNVTVESAYLPRRPVKRKVPATESV